MKRSSILRFSLLATVLLAVQSVEAVGEMGGFVSSGGGFSVGGISGGYNGEQSFETSYHSRRIGPTDELPETPLLSTVLCLSLFGAMIAYAAFSWHTYNKTTLMMVQVAMKNSSPEIQRHLSQIAKKWTMVEGEDLSSKSARGILSETLSHILLHLDCCFSATSSMELMVDNSSWERRFEKMCIEQREKSNGRIVEQSVGNQVDEYVVVTVLVAAFGSYKLPLIHCLADLKKAISCLQSARGYIADVKVFWTPPDGTTKILEKELLKEFPQLRALESQRSLYKPLTTSFRPPPSMSVSDDQSRCHEGLQDSELGLLDPLMSQKPHSRPPAIHFRPSPPIKDL